MRIPRFWAVAEGRGGEDGLFRRVWGWSMSSAADALAVAQERLQAVLGGHGGDRAGFYYPRVPLREPVLEEVLEDGEQVFVITRNRYGAEVLNTDKVLIADVDLPELEDLPARGRWAFWRSRRQEQPGEPEVVAQRLGALERWSAANAGLGMVVHRTASGLRVFVTGVAEPATSAEGRRILEELGTDPIYRELCRTHGTFRARLTPKPWRLAGMRAPSGRWPYPPGSAARRFERWLATYRAASGEHAVCRRLAAYGMAAAGVQRQIIEVHDELTRAQTALPLA